MISIWRDPVDHSGIYDTFNREGVVAAWYTDESGALVPATHRYREVVYKSRLGTPPADDEVLHLCGLDPVTEEGHVIVYYQNAAPAKKFGSRSRGWHTVPARDAQWGMLVLKFKGDPS